MPHSPELEHELEKSALVEKLAKRLQTLIVGSGIPLPEVVRMLGAEEFFEEVGKGKNIGRVFHFKEWAKEEVQKALEKRSEGTTTSSPSLEDSSLKLPEVASQINETILPPGAGEIVSGSGKGIEKKEVFPRTLWLMELLSEMNLKYELKNGRNTKEMMRGLSYVEVLIPDIKKVVFVNDEEGNATYVIHGVESDTEMKMFRKMKKEELQLMRIDGKVSYLEFNQGDDLGWKMELKEILEMEVGGKKESENKEDLDNENEKKAVVDGNEETNLKIAPEGWIVMKQLAENFGVDREKIKSTAILLHDDINKLGHEVFKDLDLTFKANCKTKNNHTGFYFTSAQAEALRTELRTYIEEKDILELVSDEESTIKELASNFGVSTDKIKTTAKLLHDDNSKPGHEVFKDLDLTFKANRKTKNNRRGFFFTTVQAEALRMELKSYIEEKGKLEMASDGERSLIDLESDFGVGDNKIKSTVILLHDNTTKPGHEVFKDVDLTFKANRRTKGGIPSFFFTPIQIEVLRTELKSHIEERDVLEFVSNGEKSFNDLESDFSVARKTIKSTAILLHDNATKPGHEVFKDLDLTFKGNRKTKNGQPGFFFTPAQAEALRTELRSYIEERDDLEIISDGEKSFNDLESDFGVDKDKIKTTATLLHDDITKSGHEVFKDLDLTFKANRRTKGGRIGFFLTPTQVETLRTELKPYIEKRDSLEIVSEGEKSIKELAALFGMGGKKIKTTATLLHDDITKSGHEVFKDLDLTFKANRRTKGGVPGFFFSPAQVEALLNELTK